MNPIFTKMVDAVEAANAAPDDYINSADGLKYCGKCRTPKEALYPTDLQAQGFTKHPVMCKCAAERREREEAKRREYERMSYMTMLRSEAFRDMPASGWRFESATVTTPQLAKARGYAQNWDEFKKAGIGLLLFGNVGTGKSYAAGCIANALIDRLESVLFVGMSDVVNHMQGNFGSDRDRYMKSLMRPDLLILDDLGAERNTSFGRERVFDVVDKRLLSGKPMIVTTNIPLSVMKQAADLDDRRIFDRILEVCVPIMFDGDSLRKSTAADNLKTAARLLG
ncbi:MAG: ATP-binding protein [Clostridiales bacterium]|nr:ATP-binding protein [Clostridiales bacterium]